MKLPTHREGKHSEAMVGGLTETFQRHITLNPEYRSLFISILVGNFHIYIYNFHIYNTYVHIYTHICVEDLYIYI